LRFSPSPCLLGMRHDLSMASAQVKTCLMFAGLTATSDTVIVEPSATRSHSERMFPLFGVPVSVDGLTVRLTAPGSGLQSPSLLRVPGDPSSAASLLSAAALLEEGEVSIPNVCIEPLRLGFVEVLRRMGANVEIEDSGERSGDRVGRVTVRGRATLTATHVPAVELPSLLDEIPVLAVLATQAEGKTLIEGAADLRTKESDRLAAMASGLNALGANVKERPDGLVIEGPTPLRGGLLACAGDHRLAMAFAVAGLVCEGEVEIDRAEEVATSFPAFFDHLDRLAPGAVMRD
jgi:3-phosphoshikimate 1-carboxyvinyltransferase